MSQINWGLAGGGGFQNALAQGLQMGQMLKQQREEKEYKNALAGYDPANPETLKPVMAADPKLGLHLQGQQRAEQQAMNEQRQAQMGTMRKLLQHAKQNPQQALAAAQQMGIDTSRIPPIDSPEFQPWVDQQLFIADALEKPEGQEILSTAGKQAYDEGMRPGDGRFEARVTELTNAALIKTIPYQPGGNVITYDPRTGTTTPLVQGRSVAAPVPFNPSEWEPVEGDAGGNASGGFQP